MSKYFVQKYTSPICLCQWPKLQDPDSKYKKYQVDLIMNEEQMNDLNKKANHVIDEQIKKLNPNKKYNRRELNWKPCEDEAGMFTIKFALPEFDYKNVPQRPKLLDSKGNDLHSKFKADGITIGGGSKIQIGADLVGYEGAGAVGASLKLRQVRVFDLKEYNGAGNFDWSSDDGFTMESSESYDSSDASMY
tara:strand:- start:683 stop:1255 length:573 start_codon:yes stop_codon:yes gene_type:complete